MKFSTIGLGFALLTVLLQITLTGAGSLPIGDLPETYDRQSNGPSFMSAVSDIISRIFKPFTTWGDRSSVRQAYPDSTAEPEPVEAEPVEPPSGDNTAGTGGPPSGASTTESEGSASGGSANPPPPPPPPEDDTNGTTGVATGGHGPKEIFPTNLYQKGPHLTGPQNAIEVRHALPTAPILSALTNRPFPAFAQYLEQENE